MNTEESIKQRITRTDKLVGEYRDLFDSSVGGLRQDAGLHDLDTFAKQLATLRDDGRTLRLGIIGRVKAGKSSLLNILFFEGKDILPQAATPMTAALTTLSYGEHWAMKVECFNAEDRETFHHLHDEHEKVIGEKAQKFATAESQRNSGASLPPNNSSPPIPESNQRRAEREAAQENAARAAGWELWRSMKNAGSTVKGDKRIECRDLDELRRHLLNYVGASGKYTAFTKCLHLELPLETLKNIVVVDTPGLNDPVRSREHRTMNLLKECDSVFIVSPSGQFLSQQDNELMERLADREGVQMFYLVASQFDTQIFGAEYQQHNGDFGKVIAAQKNTLAAHAQKILSSWAQSNIALKELAQESTERIRICSSIAHLLLQNWTLSGNEDAEHLRGQLESKYTGYFKDSAARQGCLQELSGIPKLENDLIEVRNRKDHIFGKRIDDYLHGQDKASRDWVTRLLDNAGERKRIFESTDLATSENNLKLIGKIIDQGSTTANHAFEDCIDGERLHITKAIKDMVQNAFKDMKDDARNAEGSKTGLRRREKKGLIAWFARKAWDGGYEEYAGNIQTVNSFEIRNAITTFKNVLKHDLKDIVDKANIGLRNSVPRAILLSLREAFDGKDEYISPEDIRRITRDVVIILCDLPAPELPELPDGLSATGTLTEGSRNSFIAAAEQYMEALYKKGMEFPGVLGQKMQKMMNIRVGDQIFKQLNEEAESLKEQIKHKRMTAERYSSLLKDLKGVA